MDLLRGKGGLVFDDCNLRFERLSGVDVGDVVDEVVDKDGGLHSSHLVDG